MYNEKNFIEKLEKVIAGVKDGKLKLIGGTIEGGVQIGLGQEYNFMVQPVDLEEQKKKQKEASLNILSKYVNYSLHDIFTSALKDNRSCRFDSYNLRRGIGKTSTLVYLAIRHDLKLVVSSEYVAKQLKEDFPTLKVYAIDKAFNTEGLFSPGEIILMDETEKEEANKSVGTMLV
ncbi:hypothetical protein [Mammaliicoccus phage vB_MscM-PMS3]|nr:hypothetical protein [Mammaliicoccus phage vB_MscM-PMS3]